MPKEKVLIIGLGEVGHSLYDLFRENGKFDVYGYDVDEQKANTLTGKTQLVKDVDVMHACYPCPNQEWFVQTTLDYISEVKPKLTIINSTVPPGTTEKIVQRKNSLVAYSPIRGMHKSLDTMKRDILFWTKYVGGITEEAATLARKHFEKLGLKVKVLKGPVETELAKVFETTYRAWMIVCFQEMHRIARHFNANFGEVVDFLADTHRVDLNKPLHFPDVIGGHCLIPNTKLLLSVYDSKFLHLVLESNEKRKEEVKDKRVKEEVDKVKKMTEILGKEMQAKHRRD